MLDSEIKHSCNVPERSFLIANLFHTSYLMCKEKPYIIFVLEFYLRRFFLLMISNYKYFPQCNIGNSSKQQELVLTHVQLSVKQKGEQIP
jgi:hypothetical protein